MTQPAPSAFDEVIRLRRSGDAAAALALAEAHAAPTEAGAPFLAIAGLAALERALEEALSTPAQEN